MTVHRSTKVNATLCSMMKRQPTTRLVMPDILVPTVSLEMKNVQLSIVVLLLTMRGQQTNHILA